MFHQLPGDEIAKVAAELAGAASRRPTFAMAVTGLRFLGRGVAYDLVSPDLARLRAELAARWADRLTPQDGQGFRPHVTIQNKVRPEAARALFQELDRDFEPFEIEARGLLLWRYLGGPWEPAGAFGFAGADAI